MENYIIMKRRKEDNIYEDPNEASAIRGVSSKAHSYCNISSDHAISGRLLAN
jgi:hypothetical protein